MTKFYLKYFSSFLAGVLVVCCISAIFTLLFGMWLGARVVSFVFSVISGLLPAYFCGILGLDSGKTSYFGNHKVKIGKAILLLLPCLFLGCAVFAVFLYFVIIGFEKIYSSTMALFLIDGFGALSLFGLFSGISSVLCLFATRCPECRCVLCIDKIGEEDHKQRESIESKTKIFTGTSKVGSVYSGSKKIGDVYENYSSSREYNRKVIEKSYTEISICLHCGKIVKRRVVKKEKGSWT